MELQRAKIINPVDPNRATKLFGGEASGILNWNDLKYPHFYELREEVRANFWIAAEVDMSADGRVFPTYAHRDAVLETLALLAHHNEQQIDLSSLVADYTTDPSVTSVFATMYDQNSEHNHALNYAIGHLAGEEEQAEVLRVDNDVLSKRRLRAKEQYEKLQKEPTERHILEALAYLAVFKGMQYYTRFVTTYEMTELGEMKSVSELVGLIHRDRLAQLKFIGELFRTALQESDIDKFDIHPYVKELIREEVELEKDDIAREDLESYIRYRANRVCRVLGVTEMYQETSNPIAWIDKYTTFESTDEAPKQESVGFDLDGFDDL